METSPEEYRDQIERWQETAATLAFGGGKKDDKPPSSS